MNRQNFSKITTSTIKKELDIAKFKGLRNLKALHLLNIINKYLNSCNLNEANKNDLKKISLNIQNSFSYICSTKQKVDNFYFGQFEPRINNFFKEIKDI